MGITVHELDNVEDSHSHAWLRLVEAYVELATYEHIEHATKDLPILVINDDEKEWVSGGEVTVTLRELKRIGV